MFKDEDMIRGWLGKWRQRLLVEDRSDEEIASDMDQINPIYIPRNHLVEAALEKAEEEMDLSDFHRLLGVVTDPYVKRDGQDVFEGPAPADFGPHITYCGT